MATVGVSHPYTCNTCQVAFKGSSLQRGHMQSDWHRYNLKRRVASLPPLSSEIFTEKVLINQATASATAAKASFERMCAPCQRTYYSENAYQNHLRSQKHQARLRQLAAEGAGGEDETTSLMSSAFSLGQPIETRNESAEDVIAEAEFLSVVDGMRRTGNEQEDPVSAKTHRPPPFANGQAPEHPLSPTRGVEKEDEEISQTAENNKVPLQKCLFCSNESETLGANLSHMETKHGLFLPEQPYLVDLEGLLRWLHGRVVYLHECLYCGMARPTTVGIQTHMRDKGHCMIAFVSEEQMVEVGQFYDFRSTYSDDDSDEDGEGQPTDLARNKLGARRSEGMTETVEDGDEGSMDLDDWETDQSNEQDEPSQKPKRQPKRPEALPVYHDEDGLHLPSGRTAGHRSLARYFRQNLHNYPTPEERIARRAITNGSTEDGDGQGTVIHPVPRVRSQNAVTRANGGLGMVGAPAAKKQEAMKLEDVQTKRAQRAETKYRWGVERRANQQKHYRDPLLQ